MQFPKTIIQPILAGSVTQCRFPAERWKPKLTESLRAVHEHRDETGWIFRRTAGDPLPVRLKIVHYHLAPLDSTTDEHAQQEGYKTRADLERVYLNAYGGAWTNQMCWVIRFELDKTDPVRLLQNVAGYTTSVVQALPDEPEAIDPDTINQFSLESRQAAQLKKAAVEAAYRERPLWEQLRAIQEDDQLRVLHRSELRVVERRVAAIWAKGNRGDKAA